MPRYSEISSEAFRHPADRQAEATLSSLPGFELLANRFVEYVYERPQNIYWLGNSIQAGVRQYSTLYGIFRECVRDLDVAPEPNLYVVQNPDANSHALGQEQPYIVVNSEILELMSEEELRTLLAHELGHIKCDHTILIQMAIWGLGAASMLGELTLGLGNLFSSGLILAFYEWRRKAELSADRASMLVIDNLETVMQTMMKMAGGSKKYGHECSLSEFRQQAQQYQELDRDNLNQIYKFLIYNGGNGSFLTHPFAVERISYLEQWANSSEYQQIKLGNYLRVPRPGAVEVESEDSQSEVVDLQRQIKQLQQEIEQIKNRPREPE